MQYFKQAIHRVSCTKKNEVIPASTINNQLADDEPLDDLSASGGFEVPGPPKSFDLLEAVQCSESCRFA